MYKKRKSCINAQGFRVPGGRMCFLYRMVIGSTLKLIVRVSFLMVRLEVESFESFNAAG